MHITARKDHFSRAVVRAVAAAAGIDASAPPHDQNSKDIEFTAPDEGGLPGAQLSVQLKCTHTVDPSGSEFSYDLAVKDYNRLRITRVFVPRLLVVVHVPEEPAEWIESTPQQMLLKRCAYWVSLMGQPPTPNTSTVAVKIPIEHVFDVRALLENLQSPGALL
jgi:hypothetical protein